MTDEEIENAKDLIRKDFIDYKLSKDDANQLFYIIDTYFTKSSKDFWGMSNDEKKVMVERYIGTPIGNPLKPLKKKQPVEKEQPDNEYAFPYKQPSGGLADIIF